MKYECFEEYRVCGSTAVEMTIEQRSSLLHGCQNETVALIVENCCYFHVESFKAYLRASRPSPRRLFESCTRLQVYKYLRLLISSMICIPGCHARKTHQRYYGLCSSFRVIIGMLRTMWCIPGHGLSFHQLQQYVMIAV